MRRYILRLDDACERMDLNKWTRIEAICDKYGIKPLVGVIPNCKDPKMNGYDLDNSFWDKKIHDWMDKDWTIAMHGYDHVYISQSGGINPINMKSEFAGIPLEKQRDKIAKGLNIFSSNNVFPKVFFAPSHTFDANTLLALKMESDIRIISDTVANDIYYKDGFTFVPVQGNYMRKMPYKTTTFCLHPNTMEDRHFANLDSFLEIEKDSFIGFPLCETQKEFGVVDQLVKTVYYKRRGLKTE